MYIYTNLSAIVVRVYNPPMRSVFDLYYTTKTYLFLIIMIYI